MQGERLTDPNMTLHNKTDDEDRSESENKNGREEVQQEDKKDSTEDTADRVQTEDDSTVPDADTSTVLPKDSEQQVIEDPSDTVTNSETIQEQISVPERDTEVHAQPEADSQTTKISGYLGKKGRLRMVSSWKKYWFVLEGRLLLYYRSKIEYDMISPCKGSITLGSPCTVKPGSASNCVFQIETRNNTITLRAENRAEQDRWMLAILSALKQTNKKNKMSHFRYSADDLAVRTKSETPSIPALIRQNTLPDRMGNTTNPKIAAHIVKPSKTLIERLESIGGQSYIPADRVIGAMSSKHDSLKRKPSKAVFDRMDGLGTYSPTLSLTDLLKTSKCSPKLPKNNQLQKMLDKQFPDDKQLEQGDWIHEEEVETINDLYASIDPPKETNIYQEISSDDNREYVEVVDETPDAVEAEVMVENATYIEMDHNKNQVEYWEPLYDTAKPMVDGENAVEPPLPERAAIPEPEGVLEVTAYSEIQTPTPKVTKMKKRQSFVLRIFNRIKRHDHSQRDDAKDKKDMKRTDSVDTVDREVEENVVHEDHTSANEEINDHDNGTDLSPVVIEELTKFIHAKDEEVPQSNQDQTLEVAAEKAKLEEDENAGKRSEPPTPPLDQLSELQQPQLPLKQDQSDSENTELEETNTADDIEKTSHIDFDYDLYDPSYRLNIPRPKLICKPKRQKRTKAVPEVQVPTVRFYQQYADCDDFQEQVVPTPTDDKLMTIDEILDDLENHHYEPFSRQKVKELIEKFNEPEHDTDEDAKEEEQIHAQLKRKRVEQSEELNSLLDELSKVANTPVSSSDCTQLGEHGPYSEEEWKSIVPIRKRRHSDPDYDIPRPHSALQIIPSTEKEEGRMQPTRFFGPVIIEQLNGDTTSCGTSITPDSLEIDVLSYQAKNYTPSIEEDRSMRSYTSHIYASNDSHLNNNNFARNSHVNLKVNPGVETGVDQGKDDIYAKPMTLSTLIEPKNECEQAFYLNEENDKNNNVQKPTAVETDDDRKIATVHEENMSTAVCYDSLEPSSGDTQ